MLIEFIGHEWRASGEVAGAPLAPTILRAATHAEIVLMVDAELDRHDAAERPYRASETTEEVAPQRVILAPVTRRSAVMRARAAQLADQSQPIAAEG